MKPISSIARKTVCALLALLASAAFGATTVPVQLLNPTGSTTGQVIVSSGTSSAPAWGSVTAASLAAQAANTVVANATASSASPTAVAIPSCSSSTSALRWTSGSGFACWTAAASTGTNTFTGNQVITLSGTPLLGINDTSGTGTPRITYQSNGSSTWGLVGDNSGNSFSLFRYVGGVLTDKPVNVSSSTGIVSFADGITANGTSTFNGTFAGSMTVPATNLTYTASGTGATAVTVANMFAQTAFIDSYGAVGNGTTDDSTPLTNAMAALGTAGGVVFLDCSKNYYIGSNVTVPSNVTIRQCQGRDGRGNPGADWATSPIATLPHINLSSSATISMSSNSGFDGIILRSGMTIPVQTPSAYAGTAIKLASSGSANDVKIKALIIGFATCMDGSSGGDRQQWDIECDANPATGVGAVIVGPSYDTSRFKIRTYPWGTVAYGSGTGGTLTRTGTGLQILSGTSDDDRVDLLDFGHSVGLDSRGNGNIHYSHIWLDNNASYGAVFYNNGRSSIDFMSVNTSLGVRFYTTVPAISIGYFLCDTNTVSGASCLQTDASSNAKIQIDTLDVEKSGSYAINLGATNSVVTIGSAYLINTNGGAGPYIVGPSGWTSDQIQIGKINYTDLPAGSSLIGGNQQSLPQVASGSTLELPVNYDHFLVTGTTTITNIAGTWDDRRLILTFGSSCTLQNGGNIGLAGGANFVASIGSTIALWYDASNTVWHEMWRN